MFPAQFLGENLCMLKMLNQHMLTVVSTGRKRTCITQSKHTQKGNTQFAIAFLYAMNTAHRHFQATEMCPDFVANKVQTKVGQRGLLLIWNYVKQRLDETRVPVSNTKCVTFHSHFLYSLQMYFKLFCYLLCAKRDESVCKIVA